MAGVFNPNMAATDAPPVMEARRWIADKSFPADRPLINVSQAAPVAPPPAGLRQALAETILTNDAAHLYGPVLGLPDLRAQVATQWRAAYGGQISPAQVAITGGCNMAFAAAMATLTAQGDEVLLPTPWYFNHKMWADMNGVSAVALPCGDDMLPDLDAARARITARTRAIVLVTPNNPTGAEYPAGLIAAFYDLARTNGIALVLDETYRDFHSASGAPHGLFTRPDWDDTLIQLYSFSKAYRLTGHRVGALVAARARLAQVEKYLDTVAICAGQSGQHAALWGMRNLGPWLAGERDEILSRRAAIAQGMARLKPLGWDLLGAGAYFAYVRHPFAIDAADLAPALVDMAGVLLLPGTMFRPKGDPAGRQELRIAFANIDQAGITTLIERLENLPGQLAPRAGHR
ncbi:aminotransferase [Aliiroseovarius sp. PTFE2010]|uniref:aminotransferase n=1 Tax=Aliiroseovarius sp. PTFE2010 TaxID=3417190 RepID=UPI003CEDFB62